MKIKLLAIVALALLLCATVPMAATAKPTQLAAKPITGPVYYFLWDYMDSTQTTLGPKVGSAVIQNNGKYTYTLTGLEPGEEDQLGVGVFTTDKVVDVINW